MTQETKELQPSEKPDTSTWSLEEKVVHNANVCLWRYGGHTENAPISLEGHTVNELISEHLPEIESMVREQFGIPKEWELTGSGKALPANFIHFCTWRTLCRALFGLTQDIPLDTDKGMEALDLLNYIHRFGNTSQQLGYMTGVKQMHLLARRAMGNRTKLEKRRRKKLEDQVQELRQKAQHGNKFQGRHISPERLNLYLRFKEFHEKRCKESETKESKNAIAFFKTLTSDELLAAGFSKGKDAEAMRFRKAFDRYKQKLPGDSRPVKNDSPIR
jgi:hypothetical protein